MRIIWEIIDIQHLWSTLCRTENCNFQLSLNQVKLLTTSSLGDQKVVRTIPMNDTYDLLIAERCHRTNQNQNEMGVGGVTIILLSPDMATILNRIAGGGNFYFAEL